MDIRHSNCSTHIGVHWPVCVRRTGRSSLAVLLFFLMSFTAGAAPDTVQVRESGSFRFFVGAGSVYRSGMTLNVDGGRAYSGDWWLSRYGGNSSSQGDQSAAGPLGDYADRDYEDGFVYIDNSTLDPNVVPEAQGSTWYWGYENNSQFDPASSQLSFHQNAGSSSRGTVLQDDQFQFEESMNSSGVQVMGGFARDLGSTWSIGILTGIELHESQEWREDVSTFSAEVITTYYELVDVYDTGGVIPPDAPYEGSHDAPPVGGPPQPVIQNKPDDRTVRSTGSRRTTFRNNVHSEIEMDHTTLWIGPRVAWHPVSRVSLIVTPRIEAHAVSLDMQRTENLQSGDAVLQSWQDDVNEDKWIWTYGIMGSADVNVFKRLTIGVGGGYSWMLDGDEEVELGPDSVSLSMDGYYFNVNLGLLF